MRLKNKKTGEIGELKPFVIDEKIAVWIENKSYPEYRYNSLAELNEEWEDLEEDKRYWYIDADGEVMSKEMAWFTQQQDDIGNRFETKEEAEKAVEKLKAWRRLKDFGCRLILDDHFAVKFVGPDARKITSAEEQKSLSDSYKLLFGGKE